MQTSRAAIWAVLADFPNIADWNAGVRKSYATGEQDQGVGATRHCDLAPTGRLEETIREWQPENRMVVSIDSAAGLPIRRGLATFDLDSAGETNETTVHLTYEFEPRGGPIGRVTGPVLDRQFSKAFTGFLDELETEVHSRAGAS